MKTILSILLPVFVLLSSMDASDLPVKAPTSKYSVLWTDSPFTSKPPPPPPGEVISPFEDYALLGVSPVGDGYRVTLTNRKNPEERILVESSRPDAEHGFKITAVNRKPGNPLGTSVVLNKGGSSGTVVFDSAMLTLKAPPAPAPPPNPAAAAIPGLPNQPAGIPPGQRVPRPRVVPPPAPAAAPGANPATGQPPQAVPSPANNTVRERTNRRR